MGVPSDAAVSPGDFVRQVTDVKSDVAQTRTARRGQATSVGAGGSRYHSGGGITIEGGGSIAVGDGGDIGVQGGGRLFATYPSGARAVQFGELIWSDTGAIAGYGLLVQTDGETETAKLDIFRARDFDGDRRVIIGQTPAPEGAIERFDSYAIGASHHTYGDALQLWSHDNGDIEVLSDDRLWLFSDGNTDMTVGGNWDANVTGTIDIDAQSTALIQSNTSMQVLCEGDAALGGTTGTFLQPASGGVSANVHMDTATGRVRYVSSSRRFKTDIQDLAVDSDAVLKLRPRSWLPKPAARQCPPWLHEHHGDGEGCRDGEITEAPTAEGPRHVGFIAEELDAAGLGDFVSRDAEGLPDGIHYDRLTAALVPLLQSQQQQIAALSERITALETTPTQQESLCAPP
jgi:hypothetical protein